MAAVRRSAGLGGAGGGPSNGYARCRVGGGVGDGLGPDRLVALRRVRLARLDRRDRRRRRATGMIGAGTHRRLPLGLGDDLRARSAITPAGSGGSATAARAVGGSTGAASRSGAPARFGVRRSAGPA